MVIDIEYDDGAQILNKQHFRVLSRCDELSWCKIRHSQCFHLLDIDNEGNRTLKISTMLYPIHKYRLDVLDQNIEISITSFDALNLSLISLRQFDDCYPLMSNVVYYSYVVLHSLQSEHVVIFTETTGISKDMRAESMDLAIVSILSDNSAVKILVISQLDAVGHVCQVHCVLVVVNYSVIAIVWDNLGMEEVDVADNRWVVDADVGDIEFVDVPVRNVMSQIKFDIVWDVWTNDVVVERNIENSWVIGIICCWHCDSRLP